MKRSGLTLVELLVVIAIIAVLLAISAPALQNTKSQARALRCQANIKELTTRLVAYEIDNEHFPYANEKTPFKPPGGYIGDPGFDRPGLWWINFITDYGRRYKREEKLLSCPDRNITDNFFTDIILYGNYGVNRSICKTSMMGSEEFKGEPLSLVNIKNPSGTLLIADCGYAMITWKHVSDKDIEDMELKGGGDTAYIPGLEINRKKIGRSLMWGQEEDAINGRHPQNGINAGFADGHIERKKAEDLLVEKIDTDRYINRSPLWKPD